MKALGSRASIMVLASSPGRKMIKGNTMKASGKKATSTAGAQWFMKTAGLSKAGGGKATTWMNNFLTMN